MQIFLRELGQFLIIFIAIYPKAEQYVTIFRLIINIWTDSEQQIIVYKFKRNSPIPVIVHWAHILSVPIIAQKILFLPWITVKNEAQLRDCFVMHLLSKSGLPSDSSAQRNRLLCTQIKTKRMMPYNLKPMTAG